MSGAVKRLAQSNERYSLLHAASPQPQVWGVGMLMNVQRL